MMRPMPTISFSFKNLEQINKILNCNGRCINELTFSCESSPRTCTYQCNNSNLFEGCIMVENSQDATNVSSSLLLNLSNSSTDKVDKSFVCFPTSISRLALFEGQIDTPLEGSLSCVVASK